jgi:hypothetical protein
MYHQKMKLYWPNFRRANKERLPMMPSLPFGLFLYVDTETSRAGIGFVLFCVVSWAAGIDGER